MFTISKAAAKKPALPKPVKHEAFLELDAPYTREGQLLKLSKQVDKLKITIKQVNIRTCIITTPLGRANQGTTGCEIDFHKLRTYLPSDKYLIKELWHVVAHYLLSIEIDVTFSIKRSSKHYQIIP